MLRLIHFVLTGLLVAGIAVPALADDLSAEARLVLLTVESAGCEVTSENSDHIHQNTGMDEAFAKKGMKDLLEADMFIVTDSAFIARTPKCEALYETKRAAEMAPSVEKFAAAVKANGCKLNGPNSEKILADSGLDAEDADSAVSWLLETGRLVEEGDDLQLKTEGCL